MLPGSTGLRIGEIVVQSGAIARQPDGRSLFAARNLLVVGPQQQLGQFVADERAGPS